MLMGLLCAARLASPMAEAHGAEGGELQAGGAGMLMLRDYSPHVSRHVCHVACEVQAHLGLVLHPHSQLLDKAGARLS